MLGPMARGCRAVYILVIGLWLGLVIPAGAKEHWTRIESPFFTLYAQSDLSDAREWAVNFEQFRRFVSEVIRVPPTQLQPLTIVMFNSFQGLAPYLPNKDGKLSNGLNSKTMVLPTGTIVITYRNWDDTITRQSFYEAGTYWFLSGFKYSGPDWFKAGLAGTFKTFLVTHHEVRVGLSPQAELHYLNTHDLIPLPQLFGTEMKDLAFQGDDRTKLFFCESWALVHYFVFGREHALSPGTRSPQLADFMEALQKGEEAEPAFQRVFGTDYNGMLQRLSDYVSRGNYSIISSKFDPVETSTAFKGELETDGGTELIHGYAALAAEQHDEARRRFLTAKTRGADELRAEEGLGDAAIAVGDPTEAKLHYTRAVELGSRNYRPYYFLGELLERGAIDESTHQLQLGPALAREAASRFEHAINLYPRYIPSYEALALLMPCLKTFSESDRQFLQLGTQVAPDNDVIAAGLGLWEIKNQQVEKGQERLRGLVAAGHPPSRWVQTVVRDMDQASANGRGLAAARQLLAEGKTDEAGALVEKLLQVSPEEAQRASLAALQGEIGLLDLVLQAEKLADGQQWEAAGSIALNVLELKPPAALVQRANAVLARVQAKK